ncbi:MAG: hypothetical protein NC048_06680 [Bacteroides sp.]|nr:hypothetical protein [Ruminococcus flavefaciens]MCM1555164.1 hypothetical protein [Bacteroides sp.]
MKNRVYRRAFLFLAFLHCWLGAVGQDGPRTPLDYLYCAAESTLDKAKDAYSLPWYIRQVRREDFSALDANGFYRDALTGYGGAVFIDKRDNTVILTHFATETASTDILDILADARIAGVEWLSWPVHKVAEVVRDSQSVREMRAFGTQYPSARRFYQMVREHWKGFRIENTGHSLGGNLTQLISYEYGITGVTFDPAGIGVSVTLDPAKKENARYVTNYKICRSLISAASTTGQRIGKTVTIYPSDGNKLSGTMAHGLIDIYNLAMNKNTGYFKTLEEVAETLWKNNGSVMEWRLTEKYKPTLVEVKVREKFGSYGEYLAYMRAEYEETEDSLPAAGEQPEKRISKILRLLKETDLLQMGGERLREK